MSTDVADDSTIEVNGNAVSGTLIGGQTLFFPGAWSSAFRADITGINLIIPGPDALTISGLAFTKANNGAGVLVIFDDGSEPVDIQVRDGIDLAFINFPEPRQSAVAQTYTFAAAGFDREANLSMFF